MGRVKPGRQTGQVPSSRMPKRQCNSSWQRVKIRWLGIARGSGELHRHKTEAARTGTRDLLSKAGEVVGAAIGVAASVIREW